MAALAGMTCRAQERKPEGGVRILTAGQHITPYRIGVPFSKTVHILFPSEVRYVDLGSTDIIAGKADGVENILALRGDVNPDVSPKTDFAHASDLVTYIRSHSDFGVSAACYPEGHLESPDMVSDIRHLKEKVDAGAQHLVSQLFFDNEDFFRFLERCRIAGINVPIEAGIMPVLSQASIQRMVSMCGASMPSKLTRILARYGDHPDALREAGIAYAIDQISDLIAGGVDGIHLYTMNNPAVAQQIAGSISSIRRV